jgi:hypothetical protein
VDLKEKKYNRGAKIVLTAIAVFTAFCFILISNLGFDYNFENFFPQNDPDTEFFKSFRHEFETDNDFIIVGLVNEEGVFKSDFLHRVDLLTDSIAKLPNVLQVVGPTKFKDILIDPFSGQPFEIDLLRMDDEALLQRDSAKIYGRGEMVGTFFSEDGKALAIQINHKQYLSKQACDTLSFALQDIVYPADFDEKHIVGRALGQTYYVSMMQRELIVFVSLSIVLIVLFLFIAFRSWWGIWVPITVILLSVVWILGIMQLFGKEIDLMLMVLPTIIFVVGMSDVVHVLAKYFEELRAGKEKLDAIKVAFKEIGLATFLTSLTTSIGFLTLLTSSIQPISDFGIYTAIGVFVAYILAYSLLPAVLILSKVPSFDPKSSIQGFWNRILRNLFLWVIKFRKGILLGSLVVLVFSIIGISRVEVNNYLLEDLKDSDPLKQEFLFFENEFAGARPFEMAIMLKEGVDLFDRDVLLEIDLIDQHLIEEYGVGALISPARIIKLAHRTSKGKDKYFTIPKTQKEIDRLVKMIERQNQGELLALFVNQEKGIARINGKTGDLGAKKFAELNANLAAFTEKTSFSKYADYRITGTATLIDNNNSYLATDMTLGLFIAFFIVAIVVGLMFKNLKMVLICLIPNIFPLLLIGALMGYTGIDLKVSTSIIFTIAFGIAVDDTIHFMTKLRLQLSKGYSMLYALKRTFISTGKAIIVTSIILCGGFLTLIMSDFLGTFYIGLLISLTLLFAVLADLLLLPVLLIIFFKPDSLKSVQKTVAPRTDGVLSPQA